jgi:mycoredoxin
MVTKPIIYGHEFCAQARYLQSYLDRNSVAYEWRDIVDGDPRYRDELRLLARGFLSVPTVVFPDGQVMVEPNPKEVLTRLKASEEQ